MHGSDSYISEIECPKRTEKSCIALKSCASVANNNMEHVVICPLHATSMPINQDHNKDGYPGTQKEGHEQVCFWRSKWGIRWITCLSFCRANENDFLFEMEGGRGSAGEGLPCFPTGGNICRHVT